ncbi:unnamed protein product [Closterium sp. NIES-65]|nr:unnamed protein product [Closterium sp. NIES-65]
MASLLRLAVILLTVASASLLHTTTADLLLRPERVPRAQFRIRCNFSHALRDDPIVFPGQPGKSHLHDFLGSTITKADTTDARALVGSKTTCGLKADSAAYWFPSMFMRTNQKDAKGQYIYKHLKPNWTLFYYRTSVKNPETIMPFPRGFRMLTGNPFAGSKQADDMANVEWWCGARGKHGNDFPHQKCPAGDQLIGKINFPVCWDGKNIDSADHRSHVVHIPLNTTCPSSHPVPLPRISIKVYYPVDTDLDLTWPKNGVKGNPAVYLSTIQSGGTGSPFEYHSDFINGWDQKPSNCASAAVAMVTATITPLFAHAPAALVRVSTASPRTGLRALPFLPRPRDVTRRIVQSRGAARCAVADVARREDGQSNDQLGGDLPQAADQSAQLAADLAGNGWRSTRRTKLVCTIGPACCGFEQIAALAEGGMNVARINMCHGTHAWHRQVMADIRRLNAERGYSVAVMMDTEGSEIHMSDLQGAPSAKVAVSPSPMLAVPWRSEGDVWTFTVRKFPDGMALPPNTVHVNYDGFIDGACSPAHALNCCLADVVGPLLLCGHLPLLPPPSLLSLLRAPTTPLSQYPSLPPSPSPVSPPSDVREGDEVVVDGGMARLQVAARMGPDVVCSVLDPGLLLPRANLTIFRNGHLVRATNAMLPTISSKDWIDIDFGIAEGVDFIAISFVRSPEVVTHLRSYVNARSPSRCVPCGGCGAGGCSCLDSLASHSFTRPSLIHLCAAFLLALIAKIESVEAVGRLEEIIAASDGAMVARGDLGAQVPLEDVPGVQQDMVDLCRALNKPVIVASHLLESMIEFPIPTRAEVADTAEAVHQQADALMLSGESAMGQFPLKALDVLRTVAERFEAIEEGQGGYEGGPGAAATDGRTAVERVALLPELSHSLRDRMSEQICAAAAQMAMRLGAKAIIAFTQRGYMASLLSRCRPNCPIFAVTPSQAVRQHMSVYWGLVPFRLDLSDDAEDNMRRAFAVLKARGLVAEGDLIIAVSDVAGGQEAVGARQSVQVRKVL